MATITVTPNTNIVLVNTASPELTTVNLPVVTPGQIITIRDNVGAASSNNPITITTTGGTVFSTGIILPDGNNEIKIRQPFGAVTVGYSGGLKWNVLNTFAFENPTFAKVDAVTVSSITFRDSSGNGSNYQLRVTNNILSKDGIKIIEAPEFNLGIARHNGGVSSLSSIVSYGLSTVAAHPHYGLSSLSSIVSYGLSTVAAQPHYGVSSLSSIVSYGLSSIVGASGSGTPSNWATYPANSNLDMGQCNIINVVDISMTGQLTLPKFTTIVFGNPTENLSIGNNDIDSQSYLKLNGPTYINGTLTLTNTNISGPAGTLSYNDDPIGGGDASTWSENVATQNVDMNGCNITDINSLEFGTTPNVISLTTYIADEVPYLLVDGIIKFNDASADVAIDFGDRNVINLGGATIINDVSITGPNGLNIYGPLTVSCNTTISGTLTVGGVSITGGGSASNWATYVATSNLNMGGCNISNINELTVDQDTNVNNITIGGTLTLGSTVFKKLLNPVGAYIEIHHIENDTISAYPLYISNNIHISPNSSTPNNWWKVITQNRFSGIILLPDYTVTYDWADDGNYTSNISNTSNIPSYTALTDNYQTNLYYTLTYTPT